MCFLLFAIDSHPRYALIVAANRDEHYARPTAAAAFWGDAPDVLAGRDLLHGGTWLGITRHGRFAAVTNYRDPGDQRDDRLSRGHLVSDFLRGDGDAGAYIGALARRGGEYNGFSLVAGVGAHLHYYSNRGPRPLPLDDEVHALSNHLLDTPWPKVRRGKEALRRLLGADAPALREGLFALLADTTPAAPHELPASGVAPALESAYSPIFVRTGQYGTRSSTVILVDRDGGVQFEERTFDGGAGAARTAAHAFTIAAAGTAQT